jgi:hypothetical protein
LRLSQAQGETKISKGEGAHHTTKSLSQGASLLRRNINWNETGFVVIYHETAGEGNAVQNSF